MRQGCYCLFLSAGWELRSHSPRDWDRLQLSREQSEHSGLNLYCCFYRAPPQLSHRTPSCLPTGTSWFNKHNHFPHPLPKKSHLGKKNFFRDMFNTLQASSDFTVLICHLFLCPQSEPDFDLFSLQFGKTLDTISICPDVGLASSSSQQGSLSFPSPWP